MFDENSYSWLSDYSNKQVNVTLVDKLLSILMYQNLKSRQQLKNLNFTKYFQAQLIINIANYCQSVTARQYPHLSNVDRTQLNIQPLFNIEKKSPLK